MEFQRSSKRRKNINLTSLIDIIFLLVVFFLLTSKFVTAEIVDLSLSTVQNNHNTTSSDNKSIIIKLTADNKFILSGQEYNFSLMQEKISHLLKNNQDNDIVLMSKKGVTVQQMVTAMDQIRASGGYNISLAEELS